MTSEGSTIRQVLVTAILAMVVCSLLTETMAQSFYPNGRYGKRGDHLVQERSTSRLSSGNRFGRNAHDIEIEERSNRFYGGSRYGKRNELTGGLPFCAGLTDGVPVVCTYTGVADFYRCYRMENANGESAIN